MSLAMILFMLISAWLAVACAMLWGVLRIARRHHPVTTAAKPQRALPTRHAAAH